VGLGGRRFHRLDVADVLALEVPDDGHPHAGHQDQADGQGRGGAEDLVLVVADQVPPADRQHQDGRGEQGGEHGVAQVVPGHRVADQV